MTPLETDRPPDQTLLVRSPAGCLRLHGHERGWTDLTFADPDRTGPVHEESGSADERWTRRIMTWMRRYFDGRPSCWSPVLQTHGTTFQRRVWTHLRRIPYGETLTYGTLAERLGDRSLARAVGAACGANPLPVLIPCHRVIRSDGRTGGYSGPDGMKLRLITGERTRYST